jgi:hypothetical protein
MCSYLNKFMNNAELIFSLVVIRISTAAYFPPLQIGLNLHKFLRVSESSFLTQKKKPGDSPRRKINSMDDDLLTLFC